MMRHYYFYHRDTGEIHSQGFATDDETQLTRNIPAEHLAAEHAQGAMPDRSAQRVDPITRQLVPHRGPAPSLGHEWDATAQCWILTEKAAARAAALREIAVLEAGQPRALREAVLGISGGRERLAQIEAAIAELRAGLSGQVAPAP